jgi:predicted metalloprotease with PDZ domain
MAGIEVTKKIDGDDAWLGIETKKSDDNHAQIRNVVPNSPAETAGLSNDDVIFAIDSRPIDSDGLNPQLAMHKPGDTVRITVLRLGEFKDFTATLSTDPNPHYSLKLVENPTDKQKAIYNSWMGIK